MYNALIYGIDRPLGENIALVLEFEGFTPTIGPNCEEAATLLEKGTFHFLICNDETECDILLIKLARERGTPVLITKLYAFRRRDVDFPLNLYLNHSSIVSVLQDISEKIRSK